MYLGEGLFPLLSPRRSHGPRSFTLHVGSTRTRSTVFDLDLNWRLSPHVGRISCLCLTPAVHLVVGYSVAINRLS